MTQRRIQGGGLKKQISDKEIASYEARHLQGKQTPEQPISMSHWEKGMKREKNQRENTTFPVLSAVSEAPLPTSHKKNKSPLQLNAEVNHNTLGDQ